MRTPTQTGILVGAAAGVVAAVVYWSSRARPWGAWSCCWKSFSAGGAGLLVAQSAAPGAQAIVAAAGAPVGLAPAPWAPPPPGAAEAGAGPGPSPYGPPPPNAPAKGPSLRGLLVRAAAWAGALSGVGWGLAGMAAIAAQAGDNTIMTQIQSQLEAQGAQGVSAQTVVTLVLACTACVVLIVFPALSAGIGALGGYVWTALRPAPRA